MTAFPARPILYELNVWAWLARMEQLEGRPLTLTEVPDERWDDVARLGVDAVWLMGVWERSPAGRTLALSQPGLLEEMERILPGFQPPDLVGSPYCIRRYVADPRLGGTKGLAAARRALARRGLRLVLDFVPNHTAPDASWLVDHPEYGVLGDERDLLRNPEAFLRVAGGVFARGRDPYSPPWPDVVQLNTFSPGLRQAAGEVLQDIADQCDGLRCDMAMLVLNDVFAATWGNRVGTPPEGAYWPQCIQTVRRYHADFLFIAEVYWGRETDLLNMGFDFCYDKVLYDRLLAGDAASVRAHLSAPAGWQDRLLRFLENHDEPRAAAAFPNGRHQAAALAAATVPGGRLFHAGQEEGRRIRVPVFAARLPEEPVDSSLRAWYEKLISLCCCQTLRRGDWRLHDITGWDDNPSCGHLLAWSWSCGCNRVLVVINFSDTAAQGRVRFPDGDWGACTGRFVDAFTGESFDRPGHNLQREGLFVDLLPWERHVWVTMEPCQQNPER